MISDGIPIKYIPRAQVSPNIHSGTRYNPSFEIVNRSIPLYSIHMLSICTGTMYNDSWGHLSSRRDNVCFWRKKAASNPMQAIYDGDLDFNNQENSVQEIVILSRLWIPMVVFSSLGATFIFLAWLPLVVTFTMILSGAESHVDKQDLWSNSARRRWCRFRSLILWYLRVSCSCPHMAIKQLLTAHSSLASCSS